jgi:hypothetical protein
MTKILVPTDAWKNLNSGKPALEQVIDHYDDHAHTVAEQLKPALKTLG